MAVLTCAHDAKGLGRRDEGLTLEGPFDDLDEIFGEMGQVAEGLMGDGLALANGPSEQIGKRRSFPSHRPLLVAATCTPPHLVTAHAAYFIEER